MLKINLGVLLGTAIAGLCGCQAATLATSGAMVAGTVAGKTAFHLYPVAGPLSENRTPPVIIGSGSARFPGGVQSIVFPDGERFSGKLATRAPGDPDDRELVPVWDSVYGNGYYAANVLGVTRWRGAATFTGSNGTSLKLEEIRDRRDNIVIGIAKDSKGNVLKLAL